MVSLGVVIYLVARAAPRVGDDIGGDVSPLSKFDKFFSHEKFEKFDAFFNNLVEKILRKVKLGLMKLDNLTTIYLKKVKKYKLNGKGINKPSLFERQSEAEEDIEEKTDENM